MLIDKFGRKIEYLRISVTDRCNLRCVYCMPEEGINELKHTDLLTFEEIVDFTKCAVSLGINKIRLTGGEPLVRKGIVGLVKMIADIDGIDDLAMTTNAILLKEFALPLKEAGLQRLNISLDTIDGKKFQQLSRRGNLQNVLEGIDLAMKCGFRKIKLNCVVQESRNEPNAVQVAKYAAERGLEIRFIRTMKLSTGEFWIVDGGKGGNCSICNRIRLSSNGKVLPCLFSDIGFSVKEFGGCEAIKMAVESKPLKGSLSKTHEFYNVGG
ncbi:MAG: radical SAM protein [Candidatus Delongbacteria bacterium]|nr:radical SAM protein [Candidatus Delongbacteria bacterium]MCG2759827.1 radical SAM protein [Candidatus Delongbacteria bacterium]